MPKSFVQRRSKPEPALPSQRSSQVLRLFGLHERGVGTNVGSIPFPRDTTLKCDKSHRRGGIERLSWVLSPHLSRSLFGLWQIVTGGLTLHHSSDIVLS